MHWLYKRAQLDAALLGGASSARTALARAVARHSVALRKGSDPFLRVVEGCDRANCGNSATRCQRGLTPF